MKTMATVPQTRLMKHVVMFGSSGRISIARRSETESYYASVYRSRRSRGTTAVPAGRVVGKEHDGLLGQGGLPVGARPRYTLRVRGRGDEPTERAANRAVGDDAGVHGRAVGPLTAQKRPLVYSDRAGVLRNQAAGSQGGPDPVHVGAEDAGHRAFHTLTP